MTDNRGQNNKPVPNISTPTLPQIGDIVLISKEHRGYTRGMRGEVRGSSQDAGGVLRITVRLGPNFYTRVLPENLRVVGKVKKRKGTPNG